MTRTRLNRIFLGGVLVLSSLISVTSRQHQHAHNAMAAPSLSLLLLLSAAPSSFLPIVSAAREKTKTHYEVLQIPQSASLKDIKKAYRKLAVQHHPDRNKGNEEEATIKFREISEAYQVLSDEKERREYDKFIKYGGDSSGQYKRSTGDYRSGSHKDPFAQFNDLFENDPFFKEAFKPLEDLFNTVNWADFDGSNNGGNNNRASGNSRRQGNKAKDVDESKNTAGGWFSNIAKEFMPNVNIQTTTSSTTNYGGTTSHSSTSRSYGSGNNRQQRRSRSSSSSTYTSKSTRMTIENGQRVLIQSMEKDGNKIEEKYVGDTLVERTINGVKEDIGRIGQGGEF